MAPSSGWFRMTSHSCSVSLSGLFKMSVCTAILPNVVQKRSPRRRSRSAAGRWSSSAIRSVKARTLSPVSARKAVVGVGSSREGKDLLYLLTTGSSTVPWALASSTLRARSRRYCPHAADSETLRGLVGEDHRHLEEHCQGQGMSGEAVGDHQNDRRHPEDEGPPSQQPPEDCGRGMR